MTINTDQKQGARRESRFGGVIRSRLHQFWEGRENSSTKANLARLRRTVTRPLEECVDIWDVVLPELPNAAGKLGDEPTFEERAAHLSLALYATHQQSKNTPQHLVGKSLGRSLKELSLQVPTTQGRFAALLAVSEFSELPSHLMSLVSQMRAKDVQTDYAGLAQDFLEFQSPSRRNTVLLRWSRDYYNPPRKEVQTDQNPQEIGE